MLLLNRNNLEIVAAACADETRFGLHGVRITPRYTEVTDGHCLVRVSVPDGEHGACAEEYPDVGIAPTDATLTPCTLPVSAAKDLLEAIPKQKGWQAKPILSHVALDVAATNGGEFIAAVTTDLEARRPVAVRKVQYDWPMTHSVFPSGKVRHAIHLDPAKLARLFQLAAKLGLRGVRLDFFNKDQDDGSVPMRLVGMNHETGQEVVMLLMPMQGSHYPDARFVLGDETTGAVPLQRAPEKPTRVEHDTALDDIDDDEIDDLDDAAEDPDAIDGLDRTAPTPCGLCAETRACACYAERDVTRDEPEDDEPDDDDDEGDPTAYGWQYPPAWPGPEVAEAA